MGRDPSHLKVLRCFFQSYNNLKWFLNIRLSFARPECNTDSCPSRKFAKYVFCVNGPNIRLQFECNVLHLNVDFILNSTNI